MSTLVTGITGILGTALVKENRNRRKVKGIYLGNYRVPDSELISYDICDVADRDGLFKLLENEKIDCIIHTAGPANTDRCERKPELAYRANVLGTKNIIELARCKGAKLVYISTNAVFDGENPPYSEEDRPNPINRYGAIKLECESLVKGNIKDCLIVRPILMYGMSNLHERKCFFVWTLEKLRNRERINIVNDVFENPLLSYQCADIIWRLIDKNADGIYHIAGKDVLSRYEAVNVIANVFSQDASLINPVSSEFFSDIAARPKNTSYRTAKIETELGMQPLGFREGLLMLKKFAFAKNGVLK